MKLRAKLIFCISTFLFCMQVNDHQIESNSAETEVRVTACKSVQSYMVPSSAIIPLPQIGQSLDGYPLEQGIRDALHVDPNTKHVDPNTKFVLKSINPLAVVCMDIEPTHIHMGPLKCEVWCLKNPNLYTPKELKALNQNFVDNPNLDNTTGKVLSHTFFWSELIIYGLMGKTVHLSNPTIRHKLQKGSLSRQIESDAIKAINKNYPTSAENIETLISEALQQFVTNLTDKALISHFLSRQDISIQEPMLKVLAQGIPFMIKDSEEIRLLEFVKIVWHKSLESVGVKTKKNNKSDKSGRHTTLIYTSGKNQRTEQILELHA